MSSAVPTGVRPSRAGDHDLRMAWVSVALLPVAFVLGTVAGEGLIVLLGYDPAAESVPAWAAAAAGFPALLILIAPGVAAVRFGRRAYRAGRVSARMPAWIGGCVAGLVVAQNVLGFILAL